MSAVKKIKDNFIKAKANLTSLDNQPLGKATLVIILFLDLFILSSIFNGLNAHTRQLLSPDDYIPSVCREIVINRQWNPTNRIDNLSQIIISASSSYYRKDIEKKERHPTCAPYADLVEQIKADKALTAVFEERNKAGREVKELQRVIDNLKGFYDTSLLETMASKQESQAKTGATREDFHKKTNALNGLKMRVDSLEQSISGNTKIKLLWENLQGFQQQDRQKLIDDLRTLNFWYPLKRLGMQMIFLLPLLLIFYAWNSISIKKSRGLQTLVSSHLLVVSFIPVFFKIFETVYYIIPKKLLAELIGLLESLKLVAIWHYLVIAVAVAAALLLIYIFQKKLFSPEKLIERRISKGECQKCGKHMPGGSNACSFCGFIQYKTCSSCNNPTHVFGVYCRECGSRQSPGPQS